MFTLPNLPYEYNSLEPFIDEETMHIHHDKHHATYVNNLNEVLKDNEKLLNCKIEDLIINLNSLPEELKIKVRNNGGGHLNHTMFWELMCSSKEYRAITEFTNLNNAINSSFASFDKFKEEFQKKAMGRFGSGWVWLVVSNGKLEITDSANQDNPVSTVNDLSSMVYRPILCLDVWEHAYYLKYQNRRADYVLAFWNVVNWEKVAKLFDEAK